MTTNLVLLSLPSSLLIGIDLLTFTSSPRFHGITNIPPGWHFLFTSPTTSLSIRHGTWFHIASHFGLSSAVQTTLTHKNSASSDQDIILLFKWSEEREELVSVTEEAEIDVWRERLRGDDETSKRARERLLSYRQTKAQDSASPYSSTANRKRHQTGNYGGEDENKEEHKKGEGALLEESTDWPLLTAHISHTLLAHLTDPSSSLASTTQSQIRSTAANPLCTLTTTSCAPQDRDDIPGLSTQDMRDGLFGHEEKDLGFLGIDLKRTWRDGAVGRERTEGARDRSWALGNVVEKNSEQSYTANARAEEKMTSMSGDDEDGKGEQQWGSRVLGEMEICFLMILTLSNYSCLEEWKRILALVLTSRSLLTRQPAFFASFLSLLLLQLQHCNDVEGGLFETHSSSGDGNFLLELLSGFTRGLDEITPTTHPKHPDADAEVLQGAEQDPSGLDEVKANMDSLATWLRAHWNWELGDSYVRRGMVELEDGERVELETSELEGEDERGEYAPVVVEL